MHAASNRNRWVRTNGCQVSSEQHLDMQIIVRLLASYRQYLPQGHDIQAGYPLKARSGATVGDILAELPIPPDGIHTCLINGRHAERDQVLQAGDVLAIFPAVGGG
jgi:molybdopterin converting factor small subunit